MCVYIYIYIYMQVTIDFCDHNTCAADRVQLNADPYGKCLPRYCFWWPKFCIILASWSLKFDFHETLINSLQNTCSPLLRSFEPLDDRSFHPFLELSCDPGFLHHHQNQSESYAPLATQPLVYAWWTLFGSLSRVLQVVLDVIRVGPTDRRCEAGWIVIWSLYKGCRCRYGILDRTVSQTCSQFPADKQKIRGCPDAIIILKPTVLVLPQCHLAQFFRQVLW